MSAQFGRWNFDGKPVDREYLEKVKPLVGPYGPDNAGSYFNGNASIFYYAFHTTKESRHETQPHITASGAVITWDGRLDNRAELIRQLRNVLKINSADVSIVAAAYQEWGTNCFAKLIGDWALSIWDTNKRALILAKDPVGTRHLYYSLDKNQVTWSTILDPLALFAGKTLQLCEEYIAGWFSFFPAAHLTPYVGIDSVAPSSLVIIQPGQRTVRRYWDFDPGKRIQYRTDREYEEHFRLVFRESVRRRLRSDCPVLAELSGGMDSSSIVCMADTIIARGAAETPRLDTISYYNDSEPNWNERPYFTRVEERRGRPGCHIDISSRERFKFEFLNDCFAATPGSSDHSNEAARQFGAHMTSQGHRVVLSGIGGDEVTGGVPTPTPQLADLLARAKIIDLAHQLKIWALSKRIPWFYLLFETVRQFLPTAVCVPKHKRPVPWLHPSFVRRHRDVLRGYESRLKLFGALPSFQTSIRTLEVLRRQLMCCTLSSDPPYEKRFPYLDRSLLEFLYAIPREQMVRPGQRRSLMRRALAGIVPEEILDRKRKAFVARTPLVAISMEWNSIVQKSLHMVASSFGIVRPESLSEVLQKARRGQVVPMVPLLRTLAIETWLTNLMQWKLLHDARDGKDPVEPRPVEKQSFFVSK